MPPYINRHSRYPHHTPYRSPSRDSYKDKGEHSPQPYPRRHYLTQWENDVKYFDQHRSAVLYPLAMRGYEHPHLKDEGEAYYEEQQRGMNTEGGGGLVRGHYHQIYRQRLKNEYETSRSHIGRLNHPSYRPNDLDSTLINGSYPRDIKPKRTASFLDDYAEFEAATEGPDEDPMISYEPAGDDEPGSHVAYQVYGPYCPDQFLPLCRSIKNKSSLNKEGFAYANSVEQDLLESDPDVLSKQKLDKFETYVEEAVKSEVAINFTRSSKGGPERLYFVIKSETLEEVKNGTILKYAPKPSAWYLPLLQAIHDSLGDKTYANCGTVEDWLDKRKIATRTGSDYFFGTYLKEAKERGAPIDFYSSNSMDGSGRVWFSPSKAMLESQGAVYHTNETPITADASGKEYWSNTAQQDHGNSDKERSVALTGCSDPPAISAIEMCSYDRRPLVQKVARRQDTPSPPPEDAASHRIKADPDMEQPASFRKKKVRFHTSTERIAQAAASSSQTHQVKKEPKEASIQGYFLQSRVVKEETDISIGSAMSRRQDTPEPEAGTGESTASAFAGTGSRHLDRPAPNSENPTNGSNIIEKEVKAEGDRIDFARVEPISPEKQIVYKLLTILFDHLEQSGERKLSGLTLAQQLTINVNKIEQLITSLNRNCYLEFVKLTWIEAKESNRLPIVEIVKLPTERRFIRYFVEQVYNIPFEFAG